MHSSPHSWPHTAGLRLLFKKEMHPRQKFKIFKMTIESSLISFKKVFIPKNILHTGHHYTSWCVREKNKIPNIMKHLNLFTHKKLCVTCHLSSVTFNLSLVPCLLATILTSFSCNASKAPGGFVIPRKSTVIKIFQKKFNQAHVTCHVSKTIVTWNISPFTNTISHSHRHS